MAARAPEGEARVVLRKGRARPLWYGHPWVYANAIALDRRRARARRRRVADRSRRALHRQGLLQRALADPGPPVHAHRRGGRRARSCASGSQQARAARTRLGLPSADTNVYRLVNSEGDDLPGLVVDVYADAAAVQITTLAMSMRRAEIYDALEAELGVKTIFELAPAVLRGAGGVRGRRAGRARRVARHASRSSRTASRWRSSRSAGRRPACSSTSARRARASRRWRAGARVLDVYAYAGGFGLAAARARRRGRHRRRQLGARGRAHHRPRREERRRHRRDRGRRVPLPRDGDAARVRSGRDRSAEVRARAQGPRRRPQGLRAAERARAAGGRRRAAILVTCSCSQNVDAETFERIVAAGAKQAGREVRVFERRGPAADHLLPPGVHRGPVPQGPPLLRHLSSREPAAASAGGGAATATSRQTRAHPLVDRHRTRRIGRDLHVPAGRLILNAERVALRARTCRPRRSGAHSARSSQRPSDRPGRLRILFRRTSAWPRARRSSGDTSPRTSGVDSGTTGVHMRGVSSAGVSGGCRRGRLVVEVPLLEVDVQVARRPRERQQRQPGRPQSRSAWSS